jgi:hypothetical protein
MTEHDYYDPNGFYRSANGVYFRSIVKGKNFITPDILGYYTIVDGVAELSEGDVLDNPVFGVTVVKNGKHDTSLSQGFSNKEKALAYIAELAEETKDEGDN